MLPDSDHLGDLLLERHPRQQILDAPLDRLARILVERPVRLLGAGAAGQSDGDTACDQHQGRGDETNA